MSDLAPLLVVAVLGGVGLFIRFIATERTEGKKRDNLWPEAARRLGGRFSPGLSAASMSIDAVVEGVEVAITRSASSTEPWTRVWARADAPWGFNLHVANVKEGWTRDIVVGDREFDELFEVKSSDEMYARAWLEPRIRGLLCALLPWSHDLENDRMVSTCGSLVEDPDELVRAARATAAIAGRGTALREEWARLAQSLGGVVEGEPWKEEPSIALGVPALTVCVELTQVPLGKDPRHRVTRVRAVCAPDAPAPRVDEERQRALDGLEASSVVIGETQVAILFAGVMLDAERLMVATALARQLVAGESAGPYR